MISPRLLFSRDFTNIYVLGAHSLIDTLIIDEAQLFANPSTQYGHMLSTLAKDIPQLYLLTATPGRSKEEFEFLTSLTHPEIGYLSITRKDLDIEGTFNILTSYLHTKDIPSQDVNTSEPNRLFRYRKTVSENSPLFKDMTNFLLTNYHSGILVIPDLDAQKFIQFLN